jgi:hypothetical protein
MRAGHQGRELGYEVERIVHDVRAAILPRRLLPQENAPVCTDAQTLVRDRRSSAVAKQLLEPRTLVLSLRWDGARRMQIEAVGLCLQRSARVNPLRIRVSTDALQLGAWATTQGLSASDRPGSTSIANSASVGGQRKASDTRANSGR